MEQKAYSLQITGFPQNTCKRPTKGINKKQSHCQEAWCHYTGAHPSTENWFRVHELEEKAERHNKRDKYYINRNILAGLVNRHHY